MLSPKLLLFNLCLQIFKTVVFFLRSGKGILLHREGAMYERPFCSMLVFRKKRRELGKVTS